ncbi:transketolase [Spirosoma utsteinense]|uniref:Transketolase n=1 Tax=Spirosoma utsteinense TaxID=2585773 RepID=A0ABR6WDC1_9BACT|nr:transketolase [Spirosoma utsteinense]MBC3787427.1 transketolase [Spirosoma utsteinense]MBC3794553.1 transketolase [Spirosoma utsteinense]
MTNTTVQLDQLSIDTIRLLSVDAVQKANSGHPGLPLGAAPMAYVLWSRFLRFNPNDPHWPDRDRFVLSAGHGSALLYSMLHLYGYDLSLDDLKQFRQMHSKTPGHPESNLTAGVEVTTGPLGQGFANGLGMAMAEAFLAATYNREGHTVVDHYTYSIVSDGDLMEGIASEAASLAGHLKLGKMIYLYDDNHISLDGPTSLAFTEDRMKRFDAYGWHTQHVADGNDLDAIEAAIRAAQADTERPSIISVQTVIGYGSPMEGTSKVHGSPLGEENVRKVKEFFGFDPDQSFVVPDWVREHVGEAGKRGADLQSDWKQRFEAYSQEFPAESQQFTLSFAGKLPEGWDSKLPLFTPDDKDMATRQASGKALGALKEQVPFLFGGSADLASSNEMPTKGELSFQPGHYELSNIWFGVREHAMGAALNGMSQHGGVHPYGGTFLNFSDYMRGAIRLTALAESKATFVFTHDSIGLGEDGPTHQPVEQVVSLRTVPNIIVIRPGDGNETVEAWRVAMTQPKTPVVLILSRQKLPVLDQAKYGSARQGVERGAYILSEAEGTPQLILIGTGSELSLVLKAQAELKKQGIQARVVSMPSWELFEQQDQAYHHEVLPPTIKKRLAVEAGSPIGWHKYVTDEGTTISMNRFGLSGPYEEVLAYFGFTLENVVSSAIAVLEGKPAGIEKKEVLS